MPKHLLEDLLDPNSRHSGTPDELQFRTEARKPEIDPTLGVAVQQAPRAQPAKHRLVTLGDSLTQGFQSGAIHNTGLCWPKIVAWEMGCELSVPTYGRFGGFPLNLETLLATLSQRGISSLKSPFQVIRAALDGLAFYEEASAYWSSAWRDDIPSSRIHNLAAYGWDVLDLLETTADSCSEEIASSGSFRKTATARSAYRVLASSRAPDGRALSPVAAARELSRDGGIESLVVMIGANNALGAVLSLEVNWSEAGDGPVPRYADLQQRKAFNVWRPSHFRAEYGRLVSELEQIDAQHVVLATVPHVTVPPITNGVSRDGNKVTARSRYFEYYTRPWIALDQFDWRDDPCITASQARAIDTAIDDYNDFVTQVVRTKRQQGHDWLLLDIAGLLDRLASRRYLEDPSARPSWWQAVGGAYPLPAPLSRLGVNSHFFRADASGVLDGGLFSLDGVHPTTVGYGIIAQEVINVLHAAGVPFRFGNGVPRPGPVAVDFERLVRVDSLNSAPPPLSDGLLDLLGSIDSRVDGVLELIGLHVPYP